MEDHQKAALRFMEWRRKPKKVEPEPAPRKAAGSGRTCVSCLTWKKSEDYPKHSAARCRVCTANYHRVRRMRSPATYRRLQRQRERDRRSRQHRELETT